MVKGTHVHIRQPILRRIPGPPNQSGPAMGAKPALTNIRGVIILWLIAAEAQRARLDQNAHFERLPAAFLARSTMTIIGMLQIRYGLVTHRAAQASASHFCGRRRVHRYVIPLFKTASRYSPRKPGPHRDDLTITQLLSRLHVEPAVVVDRDLIDITRAVAADQAGGDIGGHGFGVALFGRAITAAAA